MASIKWHPYDRALASNVDANWRCRKAEHRRGPRHAQPGGRRGRTPLFRWPLNVTPASNAPSWFSAGSDRATTTKAGRSQAPATARGLGRRTGHRHSAGNAQLSSRHHRAVRREGPPPNATPGRATTVTAGRNARSGARQLTPGQGHARTAFGRASRYCPN